MNYFLPTPTPSYLSKTAYVTKPSPVSSSSGLAVVATVAMNLAGIEAEASADAEQAVPFTALPAVHLPFTRSTEGIIHTVRCKSTFCRLEANRIRSGYRAPATVRRLLGRAETGRNG